MVRDARKEDAAEIAELFRVILTDMELPVMDKVSWESLKPALVETIRSKGLRYSFTHAVVKEIDGEIAGLCFGYPGGFNPEDGEAWSTILKKYKVPYFEVYQQEESEPDEWYLDSLVTKSGFRGRGVARELMKAAYQKTVDYGVNVIGLNCEQANHRARMLYEKEGFRETGQIQIADHQYAHMQKRVK